MHRISSTSFRIYQSTQVPTGRNKKLMHERNIGLHFQCCRSFSIFHWQGCLTATCCEAMVRHRWSALAEPLKARGHEIHTFTRALCCVSVLTCIEAYCWFIGSAIDYLKHVWSHFPEWAVVGFNICVLSCFTGNVFMQAFEISTWSQAPAHRHSTRCMLEPATAVACRCVVAWTSCMCAESRNAIHLTRLSQFESKHLIVSARLPPSVLPRI